MSNELAHYDWAWWCEWCGIMFFSTEETPTCPECGNSDNLRHIAFLRGYQEERLDG